MAPVGLLFHDTLLGGHYRIPAVNSVGDLAQPTLQYRPEINLDHAHISRVRSCIGIQRTATIRLLTNTTPPASAGRTPRMRSSCGGHLKHIHDSLISLSHSLCWQSPVRHRHQSRAHREHGPAHVRLSWTHVMHRHHSHAHGRRLTLREVIPLHALCVSCLHLGHLHASTAGIEVCCLPESHLCRPSEQG